MRARLRIALAALRDDGGFTIIETLVAIVVLIIGALGTFLLVDTANGRDVSTRARQDATSIARQVLESAHTIAYGQLDQTTLNSAMGKLPGYQGMSGPATASVKTGNVTYAVTTSECAIDDAADGFGPHTQSLIYCPLPDNANTGSSDPQDADLKRITSTVSWTDPHGASRAMTIVASTLVSSAGSAVGPTMMSFKPDASQNVGSDPTAPLITSTSTTCQANVLCFTAVAPSGSQQVIFSVDGVDQTTNVTRDPTCPIAPAPCATWHLRWDFSSLSDGSYRIDARAVDPLGDQGQPSSIPVQLDRGRVSAVSGIWAGYNKVYSPTDPTSTYHQVVELQWTPNPERNIVGYRVDRLDAQGNIAATVCPSGPQPDGITSCIDLAPPDPTVYPQTKYQVTPLYRNSSGVIVDGTPTAVTVNGQVTTSTTTTRTFGFVNSTSPSSNATLGSCPSGTRVQNLTDAYPGGTSTTFTGSALATSTLVLCTPVFGPNTYLDSAPTPIDWSGPWASWANGSHTCTVTPTLKLQQGATATTLATLPTFTFSKSLTSYTGSSFSVSATPSLAGGQIVLSFSTTGSACGGTWLTYGGANQGTLRLPIKVLTTTTWTSPPAPTNLTASAGANGTVLTFNGPTSGVSFFRVYRDGQAYDKRYDVCDEQTANGGTPDCLTGTSGTFSYTDGRNSGGPHTYWVTAVGYDPTGTKPSMSESNFSNVAQG